jgi:hypothetical protein
MKLKLLILMVCVSFATAAALAHGDEQHVIGTVASVTKDSITVKTTANALVTVAVAPETTFTRNKATARLADLSVGNRVVIHAKEPSEGKLVADTVQFNAAPAKPNAATAKRPAH